jgi:hypothetical protein
MKNNSTTPQGIHQKAMQEAMAAADSCTPTPMVVGSPSTPWGSDIDYAKPTYYVADGPCGYAWVKIKGRGAFAKWAKQTGVARPSALGGYTIYPSLMTQSIERKEAWANAYAQVLRDHGIEAYVDSRLD